MQPLPAKQGGNGANSVSASLDAAFGSAQGMVLYRDASTWKALGPGTSGQVLQSGGSNANPSWTAAGSGTVTTSGSPTAGQFAQFVSPTVIAGVTGIGSDPINLAIGATVSGNALTVSILTAAGAAPSAASPVYIPFRDPAVGNGDLQWLAVTSAVNLTVPSGATLGTVAGVLARIWVVAIANSGAVNLGVQVCTDGASAIFPLAEYALQNTAKVGGASNSAGALYTSTGAAGVPMIVLGFVEATEATAGTWATAPSAIRLHTAGGRLPGDVVQVRQATTTSPANNNTNAYTAGALTATITPTSAVNVVQATLSGGTLVTPTSGVSGFVRIARGNTASGTTVAETSNFSNAGQVNTPVAMDVLDWPATASAVTYAAQMRDSDNSTNITYPGNGRAVLKLAEIMA